MTKEIFSWDTHYLAFTLVLRMRLTWVRKIPDLQTIQDRLPHSCMGPVTSYRLRWRGGGGRKRVRRRRGRRSEDFGVEWHAFQGDQVNYTVRQPNPPIPPPPPTHLSPQAINMTGSLTENFDAFTDLSCRGYLKHFLTQQFSSVCFSVTVPLSSDSFWSNLKSQFTGRSHRALFEESLKEIYRNMYNTVKEAHY